MPPPASRQESARGRERTKRRSRASSDAPEWQASRSESTLPTPRQMQGNNLSSVNHREGVVPDIPDTDLALRLLLLEINPGLDRCFLQVAHRPRLAIYQNLEAGADAFSNHAPVPNF